MNDAQFMELTAWLTEAGLAGVSELAVVTGFCERAVAAGLPIARGYAFVDTLHPVHEGRVVRWGQDEVATRGGIRPKHSGRRRRTPSESRCVAEQPVLPDAGNR